MESFGSDQILRPRKGKWALILVICAACAVFGCKMLGDPDEDRVKAYLCIAAGIFGAAVALAQLIPGSSFLQLSPEGLVVRTIWRTKSYRWSDIEQFGVAEVRTGHLGQRQKLVGYDYSPSSPEANQGRALKDLNRKLSGFEASLPDNYGWSHAELAEHLNTLKSRYAGR